MKKDNKWMILLLLFAVMLVLVYFLYSNLSSQMDRDALTTETQGAQSHAAPDFTVYDLEGNSHSLSDFRGKPVILNFWASWCGPCQSEMPDFEEKYQEYGEDVHFLMVNLTDGGQETVESAWSFISSKGYTFPVYYDTEASAAMAYGVRAVPVTYFIDAQGNLVTWGQGAMSGETLQKGIDLLLEKGE